MSTLLAPGNTLERMLGINNYSDWEFWVFKKPILKEVDENEDFWLERLTYTATAIEEQIKFIENDEELIRSEQLNEMKRLKRRLFQFHKEVGEIPTFKGWEGKYDAELKSITHIKEDKQSKKNKFRQFLRLRIEASFKVSIGSIWNELYNHQNQVIENLIEIQLVTGKEKTSKVHWIDDSTGNEGRPLTRNNVAKAMSSIRSDIKNKK